MGLSDSLPLGFAMILSNGSFVVSEGRGTVIEDLSFFGFEVSFDGNPILDFLRVMIQLLPGFQLGASIVLHFLFSDLPIGSNRLISLRKFGGEPI